jgi:uncharacterized protein
MERTKAVSSNQENMKALKQRLQVLSALTARAEMLGRLGMSYDDKRDLYQALGYKLTLEYRDYATFYTRHEIAKAVINKPAGATWRGGCRIEESDNDDETALEKAWKELDKSLNLRSAFLRLDKLASLGKYGVLFLGFSDAKSAQQFIRPVAPSKNIKLLYVKPLGELHAQIQTYDNNAQSNRFGLPDTYNLEIVNAATNTSSTFVAHHSRIIHVPGELLESEYEGVPVLEVIYNRCQDLEKLVGGSAEMFWRGARPGYSGKVDKDFVMSSDTESGLRAQIDEYEHNLRRILVNEGIDLTALAIQVADPTGHMDIQLQMISAVTGIPKRILVGSERGELASSQDEVAWKELIQDRRDEYATPQIVRPFVDRMIEKGVLPPPDTEYDVQWEDLFAQSDREQAEVGRTRSESLRNYTLSPTAESIVPPDAFYQFFLGLDDDQIELITEMKEAMMAEEQNRELTPEEQAIIDAEAKAKANLNNPQLDDDEDDGEE